MAGPAWQARHGRPGMDCARVCEGTGWLFWMNVPDGLGWALGGAHAVVATCVLKGA